jgi:N-methylhydantoinase B/oxoprolinase/acetone carboxylase alpha subunit
VSERGPEAAAVSYWDLEWAAAWAIESAKSMIEAASTMMSANLYEKNLNRVRAFIEERGTATSVEMLRKFRDISSRDLRDITERLAASGEYEATEVTTKGRTARGLKAKGGKG